MRRLSCILNVCEKGVVVAFFFFFVIFFPGTLAPGGSYVVDGTHYRTVGAMINHDANLCNVKLVNRCLDEQARLVETGVLDAEAVGPLWLECSRAIGERCEVFQDYFGGRGPCEVDAYSFDPATKEVNRGAT